MPDGDSAVPRGPLTASVAAGESGPVIMLCGEAGPGSKAQLSALLARQLAGGTRQLTVDVSGLRFADPSHRTAVRAGSAQRPFEPDRRAEPPPTTYSDRDTPRQRGLERPTPR